MEKSTVVEVVFARKKGKYNVKLKALHNGSHLVEKTSFSGNAPLDVFEYANAFIDKHNATNIALKRGILEDSFAKYLTDTQENGSFEEEKVIEGVSIDAVSEENQELLADLRTYKLCVNDTVRHKDYESMLLQGVLYNNIRKELLSLEGVLANPFEATVDIPLLEKAKILSAVTALAESELKHGLEPFKTKKYNRLLEITKTDYKLIVNLV